jgi:predicted ATPase
MTGAAGAGKSRLGHELIRKLEARGQPPEIWLGRADALATSMPFGLLAQMLRRVFGLAAGDPLEARRDKVRARLARRPELAGPTAAELLGALAGRSFGGIDDSGVYGPMATNDELGEAFVSLLRAECAAQPVVIVLEDLQWGDLPTLKLVESALGALADQPLMVLALARPEVHEVFPQLWAERRVQELRLRKLSRRASEQLVQQALGDAVEPETLRTLVERSEGHAFHLQELIRAVAEGKGATTPPAVLAMVQSRIEKLDPAARRVLRAASIFGETFWRGGVEALLGGGETTAWLAELVEQDVVAVKDNERFPAEVELRFRHPLVREVAYEMLTEGDRVAGHWLAGQWLEQAGETDALILEEHFERCGRGGEPSRA